MKKVLSILLTAVLLIGMLPAVAIPASAATQSEAVTWAKAQVGKSLDYDKAEGAQCVDLIYYYYKYLGVSPAGGNACDYVSNALPAGKGWERITSNITLQPGDIVVWKPNYNDGTYSTYWAGHIGIVVSGNSSKFSIIHQNFNNVQKCVKSDNIPTSIISCIIRPKFSGSHTHNYNNYVYYWAAHPHYKCYECSCGDVKENKNEPMYLSTCEECKNSSGSQGSSSISLSWSKYTDKYQVKSTNAALALWCDLSGVDSSSVSKVGINLYDYNGTRLKSRTDNVTLGNHSYIQVWYDVNSEIKYTLKPGTTYKFEIMALVNGKKYYSPVYSFKTSGTHSHQYDNSCDKTCNTCGAKRSISHAYSNNCDTSCNVCSATRNITHNYFAATCKEKAKCSVCGVSYGSLAGHNFGAYVYNNDATDAKDGTKTRTCSVCKKTETVTAAGTKLQNPFKDVKANEYYTEPVLWAVGKKITNGMSANSFAPNNECTRGQIVTFLWRAAGSSEPTSTKNPFVDVKSDQYYYKAVLWAVEKGITTGTSATTFSPDAGCTRGQVVTFLHRAKGKPSVNATNSFKDVKTSAYYGNAVLWAVKNNITNGMGDGTFAPDTTCTRGQIVTFLYRAYK